MSKLTILTRIRDAKQKPKKLGEGAFGRVFVARDLHKGTDVAIKQFALEASEIIRKSFLDEISILTKLNHKNIVRILDQFLADDVGYVVLQLADLGDLATYLHANDPVPFSVRISTRNF